MLSKIKEEQEFIDTIQSETLEISHQKLQLLETKRQELAITIEKFTKDINYYTAQNQELEKQISDYKQQIIELKKQKINKIKNFLIILFSLGKKNHNQNINTTIKAKTEKYQPLENKKTTNETIINNLKLNNEKKKNEQISLLNEIDKIKSLIINLLKINKEKQELEIFNLNEKNCNLENQISFSNNSSDEGFDSKSASTESLHTNNQQHAKKQAKSPTSKVNNQQLKEVKPWEETLRKYPYPVKKCQQHTKIKSIKI